MSDGVPQLLIPGVEVFRPHSFADARGAFVKIFQRSLVPHADEMVECNYAERAQNTLVGLHVHPTQADYWTFVRGRALVAVFDMRPGSPTERQQQLVRMGEDNLLSVYIPPGVAHGFYAETDVILTYLQSRPFGPAEEHGVRWDDPEVGIAWPTTDPLLSERDRTNPLLAAFPAGLIAPYTAG
jgi:dTDP-4-dehydrorhamnose 3,5-epimerase